MQAFWSSPFVAMGKIFKLVWWAEAQALGFSGLSGSVFSEATVSRLEGTLVLLPSRVDSDHCPFHFSSDLLKE